MPPYGELVELGDPGSATAQASSGKPPTIPSTGRFLALPNAVRAHQASRSICLPRKPGGYARRLRWKHARGAQQRTLVVHIEIAKFAASCFAGGSFFFFAWRLARTFSRQDDAARQQHLSAPFAAIADAIVPERHPSPLYRALHVRQNLLQRHFRYDLALRPIRNVPTDRSSCPSARDRQQRHSAAAMSSAYRAVQHRNIEVHAHQRRLPSGAIFNPAKAHIVSSTPVPDCCAASSQDPSTPVCPQGFCEMS